jgi:hypothetical protein
MARNGRAAVASAFQVQPCWFLAFYLNSRRIGNRSGWGPSPEKSLSSPFISFIPGIQNANDGADAME